MEENIIKMLGIDILEHDGYTDPFDDCIQYHVIRWCLDDMEKYTNKYTVAYLFPDENPKNALKRELKKLTVQEYLRTVKDRRFPNRSEMREFGKVYNSNEEIYIKIRVELLGKLGFGNHTTFVMSFHFAEKPFSEEIFPYRKESQNETNKNNQ